MALEAKLQDRLKSARTTGVLSLDHFGLERVPDIFAGCTSIVALGLRGNKLRELPEWVAKCRKLRKVDLRGNPIAALPGYLAELPRLEVLYLDGTRIRTLPTVRPLKELWLPEGVRTPPRQEAAVERIRKWREDHARWLARFSGTKDPAPARRAVHRPPWRRIGGVASLNASLAVLLGEASAAVEWNGSGSPLAKPAVAARLRNSRIVEVGDLRVVDSAAGQGTADVVLAPGLAVGVIEPSWDVLADQAEDPVAAARALSVALSRRGKPLGRVGVPGGRLVLAWCWADMSEHAAALRRAKSARGAVRSLADEGLVLGLKPGVYSIERRSVPIRGLDRPGCVIAVR